MFVEISPAYLVASLFFITCGCYVYLTIVTLVGNAEPTVRRDYFAVGMVLVVFSLSYGLMTITNNDTLRRVFWAVGFISGFMFFPGWLLFLQNILRFRFNTTRTIIKVSLFTTAFLAILCVASNKTVFVLTDYGYQFSYQNSPMFRIAFLYASMLAIPLCILQLRWWREAELKRFRNHASIFMGVAVFATVFGFFTDFFVPVFLDYTLVPLGSVSILSASMTTYSRMLSNKALRITVQNVSGYTFSSVEIPILVLAQLNRNPENRTGDSKGKPRLSDLRESGSIEQDADLVGLLMREEYYADNDEEKQAAAGKATLIIAKQRNGPTGDVELTFLKEFTRFENRAKEQA